MNESVLNEDIFWVHSAFRWNQHLWIKIEIGSLYMLNKGRKLKIYRVRVLDFSYKNKFNVLCFKYIYYSIEAQHKTDAFKKAQTLYMRGEKGECSESLPFLLKLFSIEEGG